MRMVKNIILFPASILVLLILALLTTPIYAQTTGVTVSRLPFGPEAGAVRVSRTGKGYEPWYKNAGLTYTSNQYHPGANWTPYNQRAAIDFAMPKGTKIYSVSEGVVSKKTNICRVVITGTIDGKEVELWYAHLKNVQVKAGLSVSAGTYLGEVHFKEKKNEPDDCGSQGPHLHFSIFSGGKEIPVFFVGVQAKDSITGKDCPTGLICPSRRKVHEFRYLVTQPTATYTQTAVPTMPETATPTLTVQPTATTDIITPSNTAAPTIISASPTATQTAAPTITPTSTNTPEPPTATATVTLRPPTFTPSPTVTDIAPFEVWVWVLKQGFESTYPGGWVKINSQNTVISSTDPENVIYTRSRRVGYTNDVDWVRWRPALPHEGYYRVFVFAPLYTNNMGISNQVRYVITHAEGTTTVIIRQSDMSGSWVDLGRYKFLAGTTGSVYMGDYTGDNPIRLISADSMRFAWEPNP